MKKINENFIVYNKCYQDVLTIYYYIKLQVEICENQLNDLMKTLNDNEREIFSKYSDKIIEQLNKILDSPDKDYRYSISLNQDDFDYLKKQLQTIFLYNKKISDLLNTMVSVEVVSMEELFNIFKSNIIDEVKPLPNDAYFYINFILSLNDIERIKLYKKYFVYEIYIKDIIKNNIPFSLLTENRICLKINKLLNFKRNNILIKKLFTNTIYLSYSNNKIIPSNESNSFSLHSILSLKKQGLYLLCIDKFIVKIGSFSESQGIGGRLNSFNGGRYDSGSITNKWFQHFIRECLLNNLSCYFKVYFYDIEEMKINIFGIDKLIIPYVIRKFETELFNIYLNLNNNIPPIFGKNCN
jgi:hypothetical protein